MRLDARSADMPAVAATRVALIYATFAALWILISDSVVEVLLRDPALITRAQLFKGWVFVAVTTLLLYGLVLRMFKATHAAWCKEQAAQAAGARLQVEVAREREQRLALASHCAMLISEARDIVLLIDPAGRIVEANRAAELAYGRSREELLGMTGRDLRAPESLEDAEHHWQASASADGVLFETIHRRRDGRSFPVEISSRVISIEGQPYRQSIVRDISARKAVEDELKQRNADLERFNRASVDRELDMIALKERINALSVELGRAPPFDLAGLDLPAMEGRR